MNRHIRLFLALALSLSSPSIAQNNKGQPPPAQQQQSSTPQAPTLPPQLYRLDQLPKDITEAKANLEKGKFLGSKARYIWYTPTLSKSKTTGRESLSIPIFLAPLTCDAFKRVERGGSGAKVDDKDHFDSELRNACRSPDAHKTPSIPSQNINPLKLGESLIIGIYDPDDLLNRYRVSTIGMTVNTAAGTVLSTDALRQNIAASSPSGGGGNTNPAGSPAKTTFQVSSPPEVPQPASGCAGIQFIGPAFVKLQPQSPTTLKVAVYPKPNTRLKDLHVRVSVPVTEPTGTLSDPDPSDKGLSKELKIDADTDVKGRGLAQIALTAGTHVGRFEVKAGCDSPSGEPHTDTMYVAVETQPKAHYYYLPWNNNPVQGDIVLSASISAQAPGPVPVTVGANPPDKKLPLWIEDLSANPPVTSTFPSGSTVIVHADDTEDYKFVRWSDGGQRTHSVAVGTASIALTAEYAMNGDRSVPLLLFSNPPGVNIAPVDLASCNNLDQVWMCRAGAEIYVGAPRSIPDYEFQRWSDGEPGPCPMNPNLTCARLQTGKEPITLTAIYSKTQKQGEGAELLSFVANVPGLLATIGSTGYVTPLIASVEAGRSDLAFPKEQQNKLSHYTFQSSNPTLPITLQPGGNSVFAQFRETNLNPQGGIIINTTPPGLFVKVTQNAGQSNEVSIYVKGDSYFPAAADTSVDLDPTMPQVLAGTLYTFQSWNEGKDTKRTVKIPKKDAPQTLTASFATPPATNAPIPVTITTDPAGLSFAVNGIAHDSPFVGFFQPGASLALNTPTPQSLAGISYAFSGWSDNGTSSVHPFNVPTGSNNNNNAKDPNNPSTPQPAGGSNNNQTPPPSANVTASFTSAANAPSEQSLNLLNTTYHQTHNISRFNLASGMIYSTLRSPSWTRQQVASAVTCPTGSPQPCVPSPALYQTVANPPSAHTIDPVLFAMIYLKRLDSERKWHPADLWPAVNLGLSLSSPANDFFLGGSTELFVRGLQLTAGRHIGKVTELAPVGVNDPTSSASPATVSRYHPAWYVGVTFNINFIQTLFSPGKSAGP